VASPTVVLVSQASTAFTELIVALPGSCVSLGPVPPQSFGTIHFSRQARGGTVSYALRDGSGSVAEGTVDFPEPGQFFRVISVTIKVDGRVAATVSG
jgi:hypothetical protein